MVRIYKVCHFVCVFYRVTLLKLITDCWFYTLLVLLFVLEILKKKFKEKKSLFLFFYYRLIIFRAFFFIFFFVPPTLNLKKNSRKSTNKKILALFTRTNSIIAYEFDKMCGKNLSKYDLSEITFWLPCKHCRSRSASFFRSWLIRIYTVSEELADLDLHFYQAVYA